MDRELDLTDAVAVLRRRWFLVLLGLVLGVIAALGYSAGQSTLYRSSTSLLVSQDSATDLVGETSQADQRRLLQNEVQFINSDRVVAAAIEILGYPAGVAAGATDAADLLVISAESNDPVRAAEIANAYAEAFVIERRARTIDAYLATAEIVGTRVAAVEEELDGLTASDPRRPALESQRDAYLQALESLNLGADLSGGVNTVVLREAQPPVEPFQPRTNRNVIVGAGAGLLLGLGLAFGRDLLDDRLRSPRDIERVVANLPNLAVVSSFGRSGLARVVPRRSGHGRAGTEAGLVSLESPDGEAAEAFRTLRAALQFISIDGDVRVIQVTSAHTGEGKTTTAANLAVALARAGQRVILVDADLRRPQIATALGLEPAPGLTDLLIRRCRPQQVSQIPLEDEALAVITAGTPAPNPSELLGSKVARRLFASLSELADVVIVDSAPVLPVSDALALAGVVDGTILVVEARRTTARDLGQALALLERVDARVLGTVLNRGESHRHPYQYTAPRAARRAAKHQPDRLGPVAVRPPRRGVVAPRPEVEAETEAFPERDALLNAVRERAN